MTDLAIYLITSGRYVVRPYAGPDGLWAQLGPDYTREEGERLAVALTAERAEERGRGKKPPTPN